MSDEALSVYVRELGYQKAALNEASKQKAGELANKTPIKRSIDDNINNPRFSAEMRRQAAVLGPPLEHAIQEVGGEITQINRCYARVESDFKAAFDEYTTRSIPP